MPESVVDRFGTRAVVVIDATATDHLQIDFDMEFTRLYLLGGDLIARTVTERLIIVAGLMDAVAACPAMLVSTVGGPTVTARSLLDRAAKLRSIVELFNNPGASPARHPFQG